MQNNMAIEFFHNSKILHFLGVKSEIYHWLDLRGDFDLADFATIVIHKIFHIWEDTDLPSISVEQVKWAISIVWTRFDSHMALMIWHTHW